MSERGVTYHTSSYPAETAADADKRFVIAVDGYAVREERKHGRSDLLAFRARSEAEKAIDRLPFAIGREAEVVEVPR